MEIAAVMFRNRNAFLCVRITRFLSTAKHDDDDVQSFLSSLDALRQVELPPLYERAVFQMDDVDGSSKYLTVAQSRALLPASCWQMFLWCKMYMLCTHSWHQYLGETGGAIASVCGVLSFSDLFGYVVQQCPATQHIEVKVQKSCWRRLVVAVESVAHRPFNDLAREAAFCHLGTVGDDIAAEQRARAHVPVRDRLAAVLKGLTAQDGWNRAPEHDSSAPGGAAAAVTAAAGASAAKAFDFLQVAGAIRPAVPVLLHVVTPEFALQFLLLFVPGGEVSRTVLQQLLVLQHLVPYPPVPADCCAAVPYPPWRSPFLGVVSERCCEWLYVLSLLVLWWHAKCETEAPGMAGAPLPSLLALVPLVEARAAAGEHFVVSVVARTAEATFSSAFSIFVAPPLLSALSTALAAAAASTTPASLLSACNAAGTFQGLPPQPPQQPQMQQQQPQQVQQPPPQVQQQQHVVVPVAPARPREVLLSDSGMNLLSVFRAMKPFIPKMRPLIKKNCEGSMLCTRVFQQTITVPILLSMDGAPLITTDLSWLCVSFGATKPFYDTLALNSAFNWVCVFNILVQKWEDHTTRCFECRKLHPFLESMAAVADAFPAARGFIKKTSMIKWHAVLAQISSEIGCSVIEWVASRALSDPSASSSSSAAAALSSSSSSSSASASSSSVPSSKARQTKSSEGTPHPNPLITPTPLLVMQRGRSPAAVAAANAAKKAVAPFHFLVAQKEPASPGAAPSTADADPGTPPAPSLTSSPPPAVPAPAPAAPQTEPATTPATTPTHARHTRLCDLCGQGVRDPAPLACTGREHLLCAPCRDGVLAAAACLPVPLCPLCPDSGSVIDIRAETARVPPDGTAEPEPAEAAAAAAVGSGAPQEGASTLPKDLQDQLREMGQLVAVLQQGTRTRRRRGQHRSSSSSSQQGHIDRCTATLARTLHQMPRMSHTACWSAARRCLAMVDALLGMYGNPGLL